MEAVLLSESPWVFGKRADAYFGAIAFDLFVSDAEAGDFAAAFELAESQVREEISAKAEALGANAVVSFELTADLWCEREGAPGMCFRATGTAARLGPLF